MSHKTNVAKLHVAPDSSLFVYRAECECGWTQDGDLTDVRKDATAAAAAHRKEAKDG